MALEQITFNIGAFNDSDAGGNNYFTNTVFEVKNQSDNTFATIYADSSGATQIPQNGIDNVSNSRGECSFYIDEGDFYLEVDGVEKRFSTGRSASSISTDGGGSVQDYINVNNADLIEIKAEAFRDEVANVQATIGQKPDFKSGIVSKVNERVNNRFGSSAAGQFGGEDGELVMGNIKNHQGNFLSLDPSFIVFTGSIDTNIHDLSVSLNGINGAVLSNASVSVVGFSVLSGTIVTIETLSESGGVYSSTYTSDGTYSNIGLLIEFTPSSYAIGEKLGVSNLSIKTNSIEQIPEDIQDKAIVSVCANNSINSKAFITQRFDSFAMSHYGVFTGKSPRALFCSPTGKNLPGNYSFEYLGDSANDKISYRAAGVQQRVLAANGYETPAVIFDSGSYTLSGQALIYTDDGSIIQDAIFACLEGKAVGLANGTNLGLIRCATNRESTGYLNVTLMNISDDGLHDRPTIFQTCNVYAYGCDINGSGASREGWEFLSSNYYIQECSARNAGNDGFNSHDYLGVGSYGVLVDCVSEDNLDDGFSPHERTNFEVWGGTYQRNGKGNIIPAFGARGFCIGVKSNGCTGQSSRVVPTDWGGFVALSAESNKQQTVMWCIECESDDDTYGFNSAGDLSRVYMINCVTKNNTDGLRNSSWFTTQGGDAGTIKHIGTEFDANTNDVFLEDSSRYLSVNYV